MPRLDTADALYLGTQAVSAAYYGSTQVWGSASVPTNVSVPVVTGASFEGDTATTTDGTWTGSPTAYERKWQENDGGWSDVSGETASTFEDMPIGQFRSAVRAENAEGWSDWAYSAPFNVNEASALSWTGGFQSERSGRTASRGSSGSEYGHAWTDPLAGLVYVEFEVSGTLGEVDCMVVAVDSPVTSQPWWTGGDLSFWVSSSLKATVGSMWSMNYYGDGTYIGGPAPETADNPLYRAGMAINASTGAVWLRSVSSAATGAWFGGGNPATNTTPTFTVNAAEALRLGVSFDATTEEVLLVLPVNHYGAAPSGFTPL